MYERSRLLLVMPALLLTLWLVFGFWPLSGMNQLVLSLLAVMVAGVVLWRQWLHLQSCRDVPGSFRDEHLPPEDYQGGVLFVVGEAAAWFEHDQVFRETASGWYLKVGTPEQLPAQVKQLVTARPALRSQLTVMTGLLPEQHTSEESFLQWLRTWQRAVAQCRPWTGGLPPVVVTVMVSGPPRPDMSADEPPARWFTLTPDLPGMRVRLPGQGALPVSDWLRESGPVSRLSRLSEALWLDALQAWYGRTAGTLMTARQGDLPALRPVAVGFCLTPVAAQAGNLWQQYITSLTALSPQAGARMPVLPLPDILLAGLPRRRGLSRSHRLWRQAGLIAGVFLLLAMLASFINNQRLVRSVGDHLALYHRLDGYPPAPKIQAQRRLKADSRLLDDWLRRGTPLRYGLGLYQGLRLTPPVESALSDWAPPRPPGPVIQKVMKGPETVRLDSLALFDSGKSQLKPDSTKVLVNALVGIKAKPGWLIVVSGHTDNTGNPTLNQTLSLKRAEAVRDWMRDTGNVPESCFAVQGYGAGRPVATNDTPEGRALNRRVEISLVPQADACRVPGTLSTPSTDDGTSKTEME
ncbi:OmpA family protein [Salmonella enterica subsp. enterica serovar Newport]|nr:OmpA family protein [Salmonella enterica subsp. enterica serovar Newport]